MSKGSGGTGATNSRSAHGSGANNPNQTKLTEVLTHNSARYAGDWDSDASASSLEKAASKLFGIRDIEIHDRMDGMHINYSSFGFRILSMS